MNNLIQRITKAGGVLIIEAKELRNIVGKARLGVRVKYKIGESLDEAGIGYSELPDRQDEIVLLYLNNLQTKDLILSATDQILER